MITKSKKLFLDKKHFNQIYNFIVSLSDKTLRGFLLQKIRSPPFRKFNNKIYRNGEMRAKNDYSKNYFWKIRNSKTQQYKFYLRPHGKLVEVDEDVFKVCYNSYKKIIRDNVKDNQARLISLDANIRNDVTYLDVVSDDKSMNIENQYKVSMVLNEIDKLSPDDKELITNLLVQEKTERELAKQLHVSQSTIHKRKNNILKKLRKKLND